MIENDISEEDLLLYTQLKKLFGYSRFREHQDDIVKAILQQRDVFAVMPTGGGKSLCYQLPATMMAGTCVVISPLISLMKDQVDGARSNGLRADYLNSTLVRQEANDVFNRLMAGETDLLYIAPERLSMPDFVHILSQINISFIAVDEAHCISEWGHDFRPDYLSLSSLKKSFPGTTVAAFTATATMKVQTDIIGKLNLKKPFKVRASFDRANLFYRVSAKRDVNSQILRYLKEHTGESGIIYRTTRKDVESTAAFLSGQGVRAVAYHAGLPDQVKQHNQRMFSCDQVQVVVATIAFGMGIDKSNVRFVIHGDLSRNMEGYSQETGRAGRDGEPSEVVLFYSPGDVQKVRFMLNKRKAHFDDMRCTLEMIKDVKHLPAQVERLRKQIEGRHPASYSFEDRDTANMIREYEQIHTERDRKATVNRFDSNLAVVDVSFRNLARMEAYATVNVCRRRQLLEYFEEKYKPENCGSCDVCSDNLEKVDVSTEAQMAISAILRSKQRFGASHIVDIVVGANTARVRELGHNSLPTYGVGKAHKKAFWSQILRELVLRGCLFQTPGRYPVLMMTEKGREVLRGNEPFMILNKTERKKKKVSTGPRNISPSAYDDDYNMELFEVLRALRMELARGAKVPPFVVFSDRTIHQMCRSFPTSSQAMLDVDGVGKAKLRKYGKPFMDAIFQFVKDNPDVKNGY